MLKMKDSRCDNEEYQIKSPLHSQYYAETCNDTASDLTGLGIEPRPPALTAMSLTTTATSWVMRNIFSANDILHVHHLPVLRADISY